LQTRVADSTAKFFLLINKSQEGIPMNLDKLNKELGKLQAEAESLIDTAPETSFSEVAVPGISVLSIGKPGTVLNISARRRKAKTWFKKFLRTLEANVRKAICCQGVSRIDDAGEREVLAEKLVKAAMDLVPITYRLVVRKLLKPLIKKAILSVLEYLASLGEKLCDGVTCTLSPLPLRL